MKRLYIFLAMLCFFSGLQGQTVSEKKVTVNYKNTPLSEVIRDLKNRYSISFSYATETLSQNKRVSIQVKDQALAKVLDRIASQEEISWTHAGGQIILKPAKKAELQESPKSLHQLIRGRVVDQESQSPLIGVNVRIVSVEPNLGTVTDVHGNYRISRVPVGRQSLIVSYLGFESILISDLLVSSGKELVLNLEMKEAPNSLEAIVVTDSKGRAAPINSMASVSARSFTTEETSRYAGGVFDPARMVQNFPGVTLTDDLSNNIVVRGNTPKNLQWRLEGVEISNPNHYGEEGSSGGGISMISSNMLSKSDFFTGAFPAEYGNALSGVFDLQFRKGNAEKAERSFMFGVLGTELSMEGPFRKGSGSSYLFNYRYSTLGILEAIGIDPAGDNPTPVYQDLAFNLNFPTKKAGTFSVFGIGGIGIQNDEAVKDLNQWENFSDKFDQKLNYTSFSGGIKNVSMLGSKGYLKNILSASYGSVKDHSDTLTNAYQANRYARDRYINNSLRYSGLLNYKLSSRSTLRTGVVGSLLSYDLNSLSYRKDLGRLSRFIDERGNTYLLQSYAQIKRDFSDRFFINTGLHINYFGLSRKMNAEPRFGLNYIPNENSTFSLGIGLHSRVEPMMLYFGENEKPDGSVIQSNSELELTKSAHFVMGYEYRTGEHLKFKAETYFQRMYDVPAGPDPNHPISTLNIDNSYILYNRHYNALQNKGSGKNYGIELSVERNLFGGMYFMASSSFYNSTFNTLDGRTFDTNYNGKYAANVVFGKEYQVGRNHKNLLGMNVKSVLNGGRRFTPINLQESIKEDYPVVYEDQTNSRKVRDYYRTDFSVNYRVNRTKVNHFFILDIQNVTNRQNVFTQIYNSDKKIIENIHHTGIIPTFNYKIQF